MSVHLLKFRIESDEKYPHNYEERKSFWLNQYREYMNLPYKERIKRQRVWNEYFNQTKESISYARFKKMHKLFKQNKFNDEFKQLHKEAKEASNEIDPEVPPFLEPEEIMRKSWNFRYEKGKGKNENISDLFK